MTMIIQGPQSTATLEQLHRDHLTKLDELIVEQRRAVLQLTHLTGEEVAYEDVSEPV